MPNLGSTRPFLGPDHRPLPGSIAEVRWIRLGGTDQWMMIRGERTTNPPLILLHGGPGLSETFLFRRFTAPLERNFTLVYWDQRGAGRSVRHDIPKSSMTLEQHVEDLDELVEYLRKRLGHRRVALFGHSWGAVLGVLYASRFPDKVSVYAASGQPGSWPAGERASYAWAVGEAERQGNERILRRLRQIGPPPHTAAQAWIERTSLVRLEGTYKPRKMWQMFRAMAGVRESSLLRFPGVMRALRDVMEIMWREVSHLDLHELAPRLAVPTFFFLGRHDHWVPPEVSMQWIRALDAPRKQVVFFERSGHEPFADEPEKFNRLMLDLVLPVAIARRRSPARVARAARPDHQVIVPV